MEGASSLIESFTLVNGRRGRDMARGFSFSIQERDCKDIGKMGC
jgi:hypothetical protein